MTRYEELEAFIDGVGFRYFRGREFTRFWSNKVKGVSNSIPPKALWPNIVPTLVVLDEFRHELGAPVFLTSTYRNPQYNEAVGGSKKSRHLLFNAIDFSAAKGNPASWGRQLRKYRGWEYKNPLDGNWFQFVGGIGEYPKRNFVHLDTREKQWDK